jgi:hypothetical protein
MTQRLIAWSNILPETAVRARLWEFSPPRPPLLRCLAVQQDG